MHQILHVVVVGFHHKRGCQVDFAFPSIDGKNLEDGLPSEWAGLPSLAMPDGAHNSESDVIFFNLPSREVSGATIFGISCYRQISANLLAKSDEVSRSTVQKSVCVLSRVPLYGVLKAKVQLITAAYFNEYDFAKVEVLSQMYTNLCDMFEGDLVDGQAAWMDISVQSLFVKFRHRALLLFKLCLLERKVVFNIYPVQELGDIMVALLSLFPKLLDEGLFYSSHVVPMAMATEDTGPSDSVKEGESEVVEEDEVRSQDVIKQHDSYGFPLSIFTQGNLFHPYISLSYLDMIRSPTTRAFMVGATNALFVTKKDLLDAIVTIDDHGCGQIELTSESLKRALTLTAADLRFGDFILKNIETNLESSAVFDGGDEWIRLQLRGYLLAMGATARSDLVTAVADYGTTFVEQWKSTWNYRVWMAGKHDDLAGSVPGHSFAGQLGLHDVFLRVEHVAGGSEGARKALNVINSTGKNLGESGNRVRESLSSWFRGSGNTDQPESEKDEPVGGQRPAGWRGMGGWLKQTTDTEGMEERNCTSTSGDISMTPSVSNPNGTTESKMGKFTSWLKGKRSASVEAAVEVSPDEEATPRTDSVRRS